MSLLNSEKLSVGISVAAAGLVPLSLLMENLDYLLSFYMLIYLLALPLIRAGLFEVPDGILLGVGLANMVSVSRQILFLSLVFFRAEIHDLLFSTLLALILISDMVDGEIARSRGETSEVGGTLDVEADASYNLIMTAALIFAGTLPLWVIFVSMLRYLYVIGLWILPGERNPDRRSRISIYASLSYNVGLAYLWTLPYYFLKLPTIFLAFVIILTFVRDFLYKTKVLEI